MHYPWDVLGIEPTEDKKAIKKAYAQLIRKHRPDEDPEGFKRINAAYQKAQVISDGIQTEHVAKKGVKIQQNEVEYIQDENESNISEYLEKTKKQIDDYATGSVFEKNESVRWKNIEKFDDFVDLYSRQYISLDVFNHLGKLNSHYVQGVHVPLISPDVMKYLDGVYGWSDNWNQHELVSSPYFDINFFLIDEDFSYKKTAHRPSYFARLGALIFDVLLVGCLTKLCKIWLSEFSFGLIFVSLFFLYRMFLELSPLKKTLGSHLLQYQFLNEYLGKPTFFQMLKRNLYFLIKAIKLTVVAVLWQVNGWSFQLFLYIFLGIELVGTALTLLVKEHLPQDRYSNTIAIKVANHKQ